MNDAKQQVNTPELRLIISSIDQLTVNGNRNDALIRNMAEQYTLLTKEMTILTKEHTEFIIEARHSNKETADIRKLVEKNIAENQIVKFENISIRADLKLFKWLLAGVSTLGLALFIAVISWFKP